MVHAEFSSFAWTLSASSVFVSLIAWAAVAGISEWLLGLIYNKLLVDKQDTGTMTQNYPFRSFICRMNT